MKKIKFLKERFIKLDGNVYRPYNLGELPKNMGCIDFNDSPGITEWFNYKGLTYIQD